MKGRDRDAWTVALWRLAILASVLLLWEFGPALRDRGWPIPAAIDPYFFSQPSRIWERLLRAACFTDRSGAWLLSQDGAFSQCLTGNQRNLWLATGATLRNTFWGFVVGVSSGVLAGIVLGRSQLLARIFEPYIVAFNSLPRIALVPLIILIFGLGDLSKIMTAWVIVFFVVFFNTFEGARAVDRDQVNAARLLGASEWQVALTVVVPSTLAWVFAALTPAISFSLIGVIVGEFIGAERGLGKMIVEAEARADSTDMMVALFVLMAIGVALASIIRRLQAYLLRWQGHYQRGG
ncbi:MAG: ABC transporter permease [Proteobacteria bacterium]|nr:ABC transporter permease [Pseudomonadota bacterium]MBI3499988.1 ABC transporter permease [Pseudomonadota bacterium]